MHNRTARFAIIILTALICASSVSGQAKRRKAPAKKAKAVEPAASPAVVPTREKSETVEPKKNERPAVLSRLPAASIAFEPVYFYQFEQPNFLVKKIVIEHDETGRGTIAFQKRGSDETITDPLQISSSARDRLKEHLTALNFLNSTEDYQSPRRDYKHLGVSTFRVKISGKQRTSVFNWSDNKEALDLAAEYRRIANQAVWLFDMNLAAENQPLSAPGLMNELDSLIRRNEISDARQILPYLKKLQFDERVPLMARNQAARLSTQIEKIGK